MATTSLRNGSRQAFWSISDSTSSPSRNRITIRATVARSSTKPDSAGNSSTSNPPSPSTKPAMTNSAVIDRNERCARPEPRAPTISSAPKTSAVVSNEVTARQRTLPSGARRLPSPVLARPPAARRRRAAGRRRRGRPGDRRRRLHRPLGRRAGQARAAGARGRGPRGRDRRLGRQRAQRRLRRLVADPRAAQRRVAASRPSWRRSRPPAARTSPSSRPTSSATGSTPPGRSTACSRSPRSRTSSTAWRRRRRCCGASAGRPTCSAATRSARRSPPPRTSAPSSSAPASGWSTPGRSRSACAGPRSRSACACTSARRSPRRRRERSPRRAGACARRGSCSPPAPIPRSRGRSGGSWPRSTTTCSSPSR